MMKRALLFFVFGLFFNTFSFADENLRCTGDQIKEKTANMKFVRSFLNQHDFDECGWVVIGVKSVSCEAQIKISQVIDQQSNKPAYKITDCTGSGS